MRVCEISTGKTGSIFVIVGTHYIINWDDGTSGDLTSEEFEYC